MAPSRKGDHGVCRRASPKVRAFVGHPRERLALRGAQPAESRRTARGRRAKCVVRRSEASEGDRCAAAGRVRAPRRLAIRRLDGSVREADVPIVDVRMSRSVDAPLCRRAEPTSRGDGSIEGAKAPSGGGPRST
ncbi:hypothetical protein [Burkholderia pseudomallei]|uniref:hypothetical protein n=1 Tax=Burkholderia pseudomallei TaxID=28450 RepID=UPI000AF8E524|nr:hypothetical protein [Burkholderia pseudomallei]